MSTRLPKASIGKGCVRFKKLADLDEEALVALIKETAKMGARRLSPRDVGAAVVLVLAAGPRRLAGASETNDLLGWSRHLPSPTTRGAAERRELWSNAGFVVHVEEGGAASEP